MRAATTTSLILAAALLAGAPAVPAQPAAAASAEVPEAVQREVQAAQEALARAVAEFEGPQQSRSIVAFDEIIARLEAVGPRALPPRGREILVQAYEYRGRAYFNIGLPEKASENFRQLVQLKPDYALAQGEGLAEGRRALQQRQEGPRRLPRGLLEARRGAGHPGGRGRRPHRPRAHRLLPPRGAGGRVHGRGRADGLPDRDPDGQHRRAGHRDARGAPRARAGQRLLRHGAGGGRDLDRRRAEDHHLGQPGPRAATRRSRARGLDPARASARTEVAEPLPGQPRRRAPPEVLRDRPEHPRHPQPRTTTPTP